MTTDNSQPAAENEQLDGSAHDAEGVVVGSIDMTPSWGEVGLLLWRLARSGEINALEAARKDYMRAFAGMEVLNQLLRTFTPEQRAVYERVMAEEKAKQDRY